MAASGTEWRWLANGDVRTVTKAMPALVNHTSGREMFFNSIVAATQGWVDVRNDPSAAVVHGDGTPLDAAAHEALESVSGFLKKKQVAFEWRAGDVLIIDNNKALHSREPFVAPRRVLASLWGAPEGDSDDDAQADVDALVADMDDQDKDTASVVRAALPLRVGRSIGSSVGRMVRDTLRLRGGMAVTPTSQVLTLRNGAQMPAVGLGLWKVPTDVCADTVVDAIRGGYRHLDCACDVRCKPIPPQ